jgi:hypothetical protein
MLINRKEGKLGNGSASDTHTSLLRPRVTWGVLRFTESDASTFNSIAGVLSR